MCFFLRPRDDELGRDISPRGDFRFVRSEPLAMHDECAYRNLGEVSAPWDSGRKAFSEAAGQDFCWSPGSYGDNHPCYFCGDAA